MMTRTIGYLFGGFTGRSSCPSSRDRPTARKDALKLRSCRLLAITAFSSCFLASAQVLAQNAYITNFDSNTVSVIDTVSNTVTATIPVGANPMANPIGVAVSPDGSTVYIVNEFSNNVSVIATASNTVTATIPVGSFPSGVAVTPDGSTVYVANEGSNNVSVIATASNTVTATIPVGSNPFGVAVTPDGSTVYVANVNSNNVSVIATASNTVTATIPVGNEPAAFGLFIQPAPRFAGMPGTANCIGKSVSALARQYGGIAHAAAALNYSSVSKLQIAVATYCGG
jgi:YVTN family beta-propeller protein